LSSVSSPLVDGDNVYVGNSKGLIVLNKKNGDILWENDIGTISSKPFKYNDKVYCCSNNGYIYAINSENGDTKWNFKTDGAIYSSPTVYNNVVYVGSNDKYLYALEADTGNLKWSFETGGPVCSSPQIKDNVVYFGSWDNNVYALDTITGELEWKFTTGWGVDSSPAKYKDTIFFGSRDNNFYAINADDGTLKWVFSTNGGIQSSPYVYGGFVFFGSSDGRFYALNAEDGSLEWNVAPDYHIEGIYNYVTKPIVSSPFVDNGKVYFGSTNGKIYCYDAETFEEVEPVEKEITIPVGTWLFIIFTLLCVLLITMFYLYISRRKNS